MAHPLQLTEILQLSLAVFREVGQLQSFSFSLEALCANHVVAYVIQNVRVKFQSHRQHKKLTNTGTSTLTTRTRTERYEQRSQFTDR